MNGIPMKLDYSKTINEQLATFEYYKNRYSNYELQIINLQKQNAELKEKVLLLQAREPMLEFAKQTYKTYWETLKQLLIDKFNVTQDTIYLDILTDLMKPIEEKEVE